MSFAAVLVDADVMDVKNIDACQTEPLQAVLERAHDAVVGVVEYGVEWERVAALVRPRREARPEQASDFRRQHPFVTRHLAHGVPDTTLGLTDAVIGRRIDIAHAGRPRGADDRFGLVAADADPAAAKSGATEAKRRHFERTPSDPAFLKSGHYPAS